jgi:hypothetical protein
MDKNIILNCKKVKSFFEKCNDIAIDRELVERKRKLTGENIAKTIINTHYEYEQPSLENYCTVFETISDTSISRQSFDEKITKKMVEYLKDLLLELLKSNNDFDYRIINCPKLIEMFTNIYILDSTVIELHENFAHIFRGSGGCASKSALKIQHLYDAITKITKDVIITQGVLPDSKFILDNIDILDKMEKGSLIITDLGYFSTEYFNSLDKNGFFYLSRLPAYEINIYRINKPDEKIDLLKLLKENTREIIDIEVLITDKKLPCRLVITPLPEEVANRRVQKKNIEYKKKGNTQSKYSKYVCRYSMVITNLSSDVLPAKDLYKVYTIRWSVELSFKVWKSKFHIDKLAAIGNKYRDLFELYGKLLCIFMMHYLIILNRGNVVETDDISIYKAYSVIKLFIKEIINTMNNDEYNLFVKVMIRCSSLLNRKCKLTKSKNHKSTMGKLCTYSKGGYSIAKNIKL